MRGEPEPATFGRVAALIVAICFAVELGVMAFFQGVTSLTQTELAVINALIVSSGVLACLYIWVMPLLSGSRRRASDQTRLLESLIDAIPAPVFYKDENGVYTGCNKSFEQYLGLSKEDIVGQTVYGVSPGELAKVYHEADLELMRQGGRQVYEASVSHADGSVHDVVFHKAVFHKSSGDVGGIIGVMLDITDRNLVQRALAQAKDEAEKASQAKSEFLAAMSHELRTPLNAILGFGQMLQYDPKTPLTPTQEEQTNNILGAGRHLLELIDQILDLARIEADRVNVSIETVDVRQTIAECVAQMAPLATRRDIVINNRVGEGPAAKLRTDHLRFKQVLFNILSNAVKYNVNGGSISVSTAQLSNGFLRISIADTGIGIKSEYAADMFQMFHRAETGGKISREGAGIGLAVCRLLVERLAGRIGFVSQPGEGSTFWFELPLADNTCALIWTDDMRVGVDTVDKDRQVMVSRMNKIMHGLGDGDIDAAVADLLHHARQAARREQAIMEACDYPGRDERRRCRHVFLSELERLAEDLRGTPDRTTYEAMARHVAGWLNEGAILGGDGLAAHARGKDAEIRDAVNAMQ